MAEKRKITAEDLYRFEPITGVRIAPQGDRAVFVRQRVDRETEKKYSNLFLLDLETGRERQFTAGDQNDSRPEWAPDGSSIAFLSNRLQKEKPPQLFIIPVTGGEARAITEFKGIIDHFRWSPDGSKLVFTGVKFDQEMLDREQDEKKKKLGVVVRHVDRIFYKLDGFGFLPHERRHIWVVEASGGEPKQLTDHKVFDDDGVTWSPDGQRLAFFSNRGPDPDNDRYAVDLFTMPAAGGELTKIATPRGSKSDPVYSPDGKWIAYYGAEDEHKMYKNTSLWIVPTDGSGPARNLTEQYDYDVTAGVINDLGGAEDVPAIWDLQSQYLTFRIAEHGSSLLKRISIKDGSVVTIVGPGGDVGSVSLDAAQQKACYFWGRMDDPGQVHVLDLASGENRRLTHNHQVLLEELDLGSVEEVWFKNPHGQPIQGWILKPSDFDPQKKYPSILEIHGGPWAMYGNFFMHEFYYLAAQGYVVYFSNPRGGKGYGEAHAAAINGDWGGPAFEDLMAFSDLMMEKEYIDPKRMGVTGGSYGGYMTNWIIGHTQRYAAAVTQRCVSNLISMWGSSDMAYVFEDEFGGKPPFEDIEQLWENSPLKHLGNATTPTLVSHSEMDLRCAIEQGEQVFIALKRLGVDTEMIRFPEEPHGLSRTGRTDRRIARLQHFVRWFDRYLK